MDNLKQISSFEPALLNAFGIIGVQRSKKVKTIGTCFFGTRNGSLYLITCEHVVQDYKEDNFVFIPPTVQILTDTLDTIYSLPKPYYYPNLPEKETFDVVVFNFPNTDEGVLINLGITPLDLNNVIYASSLTKSIKLMASGFPEIYLKDPKTKLFSTKSNVIPPWKRPGEFEKSSLSEENFIGTNKKYLEVFCMRFNSRYRLSGVSGGVVQAFPEGKVTGVCFGQNREFIYFADIKRTVEIIDSIK